MFWNCGKFRFDTATPTIMGVLNVTPDSFSDGGKFLSTDKAIEHARSMSRAGAAIIDVGGESSRPGATPVEPDEEWARIQNVVEALVGEGLCVSVDTRHFEVAERAIQTGASIINDISGFRDERMVDVVSGSDVGLVVMHMQGEPSFMQDSPTYSDVVVEVRDYLSNSAELLTSRGIAKSRICLDPGPGFGKTSSQTMELMRNIHEIVRLGYPVMAAVSRKSFIRNAYHIDDMASDELDEASAKESLYACELGASIVRTHNVSATLDALSGLRPYVILGLGSNVALVAEKGEEIEGKKAQIDLAIAALCQLPDSQIIDMSSYYISEPAYVEDQEEFVNVAILLRTGIPPKELLDYLHAIEATLGRTRDVRYGPRTIDIDIIDYQLYTAISDELVLPHPKACDRDFVIKPVCEMLPNHILADGSRINAIPEEKRVGRATLYEL